MLDCFADRDTRALASACRSVASPIGPRFDERALLRLELTLTNREHARRLNQLHPTLGPTFAEIVDRYDRVRYGSFAVAPAFFTELSDLVGRLRSAALSRAVPGGPAA